MIIKNSPKFSKKFCCEKCNYYANRISDLNKHYKSKKHNAKNANINANEKSRYGCVCGKEFKHPSSLSRHKKKCPKMSKNVHFEQKQKAPTEMIEYYKDDLKDMIIHLMGKNDELITQNYELIKEMKDIVKEPKIVNNTTNNNNTQFNVMNYLNNECKDAMNFTDFIDTFEFTMDDLHMLANKGYQKTMENTFIRQLRDMEKTKRPIHCSDKKRKSFYVKEDGSWKKDNENITVIRGVKRIASRHFTSIHKWREYNPDCFDDDRKHLFFNKAMGQVNKCDNEKHMNKVVNHLSSLAVRN